MLESRSYILDELNAIIIIDNPELKLTNEQKLGMIVSVMKDKMDSQQLKNAIKEVKLILES